LNPENIPLVMLFAFSGFLFALWILAFKAMQYQQRRDEEEGRENNSHNV
jgi:cytoskeletal protein RodZ